MIRPAILLLSALLLAGCAPRMAELPQPPKQIVQYGYSFMPLDEPGWKVAARDGNRLILGKVGESRDETVIIMAGNVAIPHFKTTAEFEAYVRKRQLQDTGPSGRFSVQRQALVMVQHDKADCARTHFVSIDHEAKKRSRKPGDMVLEVVQLTCHHPDNDGTATFLGYSQRYYPGSRDPAFDAKGERLLQSLHFTPF